MKRMGIVLFLTLVLAGCTQTQEDLRPQVQSTTAPQAQGTEQQQSMRVTSSAFENSQPIPLLYTCDGSNANPPLIFQDVPQQTKSLALIVDDPDAPRGTFVHWVLYNLSPSTVMITENSVPQGATEGKNGAGQVQYTGPCPPSGTHRYFFKVYALDLEPNLPNNLTKEELEQKMRSHILSQGELVGLYQKK